MERCDRCKQYKPDVSVYSFCVTATQPKPDGTRAWVSAQVHNLCDDCGVAAVETSGVSMAVRAAVLGK